MVESAPHAVRVRKGVTLALLGVVSALIVVLTFGLAGHAYARQPDRALTDVPLLLSRIAEGHYSNVQLLALALPPISNALVFAPWGFLMFIWLDRPGRPVYVSYALTCGAGAIFALALGLWQVALPTRVTDVGDSIWNSVGALAGAVLGQLRKRVRLVFE
jgi:glycopeptide antibiotics resistance protein